MPDAPRLDEGDFERVARAAEGLRVAPFAGPGRDERWELPPAEEAGLAGPFFGVELGEDLEVLRVVAFAGLPARPALS